MKNRFFRFMQGRNGPDEFSSFLMITAMVILVFSVVLNLFGAGRFSRVFYLLALAVLFYTIIRMFSKNLQARRLENQKYLTAKQSWSGKIKSEKNVMRQRKTYRIFRCPSCGQRIRVPKKKGRIEIRCPKCGIKFIKNTGRRKS